MRMLRTGRRTKLTCRALKTSGRYRTRIPFWNLDLTKCESKATPNPTLLCHWARESFRCCSTSVEGLKTAQSGNLTCKLAIVSKASLQALLCDTARLAVAFEATSPSFYQSPLFKCPTNKTATNSSTRLAKMKSRCLPTTSKTAN